MCETTRYRNTDLVLTSSEDLTALAAVFESRCLFQFVTRGEDSLWYASFATQEDFTEPEPNIAAMVAVAESLGEPHRTVWLGCTRREFNISFDCGTEPWSFIQGMSSALLSRIAAIGASLALTLYAYRGPGSPSQTQRQTRGA